MKILHVISSLDPLMGGLPAALVGMARQQAEAGLSVAICTTNRGLPAHKQLSRADLLKIVGQNSIQLHVFDVDVNAILYSDRMRRWLQASVTGFDAVHIHGLYRFPTTYAGWCARVRQVPFIVQPHGALDPYLYKRSAYSTSLKRLYERWFEFPNLNGAGTILYTSDDERIRAKFLSLKAATCVIPNGLDWARYETLPQRGAFRRKLGIGTENLLLFLGRINFKKGLDLLIPAFQSALQKFPDTQLAIVGPDSAGFKAKVKTWVREAEVERSVHFVDHLSGREVVQAYVDANVFVLPSYSENFGLTVAESMACGTPVIISDQVNIWEQVHKAGAGLVCPCNVDELAHAIMRFLSDPVLRIQMGCAGRVASKSLYAWEPIVNRLSELYRETANGTVAC